ncbi:MAG: hypothetical protein JNK77_16800 [Saprospiraceae bacterium]|nr:hypothetical protein [Saprospiraceae bacterium]
MSDPQFDDHLRHTLSDHRSPLDTGALWDRLSPLLAEDKKRRRGFFWWWAGGAAALVLALGGATLGLYDYTTVRPADDNDSPLGAGGATLGLYDCTTVRGADDTNSPLGAGGATLGLYDFTTVRPADETDSPLGAGGATGRGGEGVRVRGREGATGRDRKESRTDHGGREGGDFATLRLTDDTDSPLGAGGATGGGREGERERGVEGGVRQANVVETIEIRKAQLTREQENMQIPAAVIPAKPTRKKTAFVLRPEAGMGLVFKTLQSHPGDSSDYRRARLDTEDALEYASAGLLAGVQHRSGVYVFAGLGYTRINERFYTSGSRTEYDSIPDGIVEIYIDSNGDSIITRGNVPVTRYITYRKRTYNRYTLLDVPVLLGYQWRQDRWSLGVEGGVYVNLALQSRGDILSENGDIISLQDADNVMRPRIGLSYYGSLRLGFAFDDKTQLSLAPSLRVLPNFTTADYRLIQKYTLLGLNVGLTRKF